MKYSNVCCGGTFDLLHDGHKTFLEFAANQGEKLVIGLTSDEFLKSHKPGISIQPYEVRRHAIEEFLTSLNFKNFEIVPLNDPYGPAIDSDFDAIVVTEDTHQTAEKINEVRNSKNLKPLEIIICPFKESDQGIISSTNIRSGKMSRDGKVFVKEEWIGKNLNLPNQVREAFKKPIGELIPGSKKWIHDQLFDNSKLITVGDATTQLFVQNNIIPQLSVIDFKVQRHERFQNLQEIGFDENAQVVQVTNEAGEISAQLFQAIADWFDSPKQLVILIKGEDDLAVLPVLLMAPLGYQIFYGQPNEGLVKVEVTEEKKKAAYELFLLFDSQ